MITEKNVNIKGGAVNNLFRLTASGKIQILGGAVKFSESKYDIALTFINCIALMSIKLVRCTDYMLSLKIKRG